ncbi:MAG: L-histidine N(alpha)-methyltransferase [Gemmatimonadaceae bacterium]
MSTGALRTTQRARVAATSSLSFRNEVLAGLLAEPKTLPPKLFYDHQGAVLFEAITELAEYYLTRTELGILERHAPDIARLAGPRSALIEYGSGAGVKVRLLLDALDEPAAYVPVDISVEQLGSVAAELAAQYRSLPVLPVYADYTARFALPELPDDARRVAFFPGSTIGNFHPAEATAFLRRVRSAIGQSGALVLGVDRRKDGTVLHAAYNDAAGVTAAFNLNMLARLNREHGATFDLSQFRHVAYFNDALSRIEMHLESLAPQTVRVDDVPIAFARNETIHTESSYKYSLAQLANVVGAAGFDIGELWTDDRDWFWVGYLVPR